MAKTAKLKGKIVAGKIVLITLPIGNLGDLTTRAREELELARLVFAEDTRVFKSFLSDIGVRYADKEIDSFHDHSKEKIQKIAKLLSDGETIHLVSDAGSPVISDPAYPLLEWARANQVEVDTVPGVSSVLVALELSLFPTQPFTFWGFLPRANFDKKDIFKEAYYRGGTHLYFESPHRIHETLELLKSHYSDFDVCVARELTKKFQTVVHFKASDYVEDLIMVKGEFVLVLYKKADLKEALVDDELVQMVESFLHEKSGPKQLAKIFAKITGVSTSDIYNKLKKD